MILKHHQREVNHIICRCTPSSKKINYQVAGRCLTEQEVIDLRYMR